MAYQYDIFLSYNRNYPYGDWVNDIFFPLFKPYLDDVLNKDVQIFKDTQEIASGADWKQKIRSALIHSKAMVSIFVPAYFRSEWCMREFSALYHRSKTLGFFSQNDAMGLVVPIRLFDGENFPGYASDLQMLDCVNYYRVGGAVKLTPLYLDLQGVLQRWVYDVAQAVNKAPEFDPRWMEEAWVEKPFEKITVAPDPINIKPPTL
jgi:TIR domain